MNLGAPELAIVLVILLVLFGGKKLPEIARGLGQAQREFRAGLNDESAEPSETTTPPPPGGSRSP